MASKLRKVDQLILDYFSKLKIVNLKGESFKVPVVSREVKLTNVDDFSQKVTLPLVTLCRKSMRPYFRPNWSLDYEMKVETSFKEDMNQILEQVMTCFGSTVSFTDDVLKKLDLQSVDYVNETQVWPEGGQPGVRVYTYKLQLKAEAVLKGDENA